MKYTKKIIIPFLVFIFFASTVFAANTNQGGQNIGGENKLQNEEEVRTRNMEGEEMRGNEEQAITMPDIKRAENIEELIQIRDIKRAEANEQMEENENGGEGISKNREAERMANQEQERVKDAIGIMISAENLTIGAGENISKIAQEINTSIGETIKAEKEINGRSGIIKFLIGGEKKAIERIEIEVEQNEERIQALKKLNEENNYDEVVKNIIREQVQKIEEGQSRLGDFVREEKDAKGVFGWAINKGGSQLFEEERMDIFLETNTEKAETMEELVIIIDSEKEKINRIIDDSNEAEKKIYQNQNQVREAVQTMLSAEDLVGGIGEKISEIAREFNNSMQETLEAEKKIEKKSKIIKFFTGGGKEVAEKLELEVEKNRERVQSLKDLNENNDYGEEIKNVIREQVQRIEEEQLRLGEVAEKEKGVKGVFGWVKNLFGRKEVEVDE